MSHVINICAPGHLDPYDSYGLIALELARHLTRLGVHVNLFAMGKREMDTQDEEIAVIVSQPIRPAYGAIILGYPDGYHRHINPLVHMGTRVGITMFESSVPPSSWLKPLDALDAVVLPSHFCADTFNAAGVKSPIHIVPLGISETFKYEPRPDGRPLTFLAFLDRGARKGGLVALQAFLRAFGDDMNYRLILKSRKPRQVLELTNPNIEVVQQDMTEQELYELYLRSDVLINPHRGEGFGILPRAYAATGGIALTTNWSGTVDGLSEWGWPLPYALEPADWRGARNLEGQDLGEWATCDPDAVAMQLQTVAANIDYYRQLAKRKAARVPVMYSWRAFAESVLEIWKGVQVGDNVRAAAA